MQTKSLRELFGKTEDKTPVQWLGQFSQCNNMANKFLSLGMFLGCFKFTSMSTDIEESFTDLLMESRNSSAPDIFKQQNRL